MVFTSHGVTFLDETDLNTKRPEQDVDNISPGKRKRSHLGRVHGRQLPDEFSIERFIQNVTGERDESWSSAYPAYQWKGVTCNREGKVTGIEWNTTKLQGTLHWENLPSTVEHLSLRGKCYAYSLLGGTLDLSVLPRGLKTIDLAGNSFYGPLDLTALPPHLETAIFYGNDFSGSVDLAALPPRLESADFHENSCSGLLDLAQLPPTLKELSLRSNKFKGSVDLTKLPEVLEELELDNN